MYIETEYCRPLRPHHLLSLTQLTHITITVSVHTSHLLNKALLRKFQVLYIRFHFFLYEVIYTILINTVKKVNADISFEFFFKGLTRETRRRQGQ